jgi:nucleotide-binding universal stress UspA family protein
LDIVYIKELSMKLLICTDGSASSIESADLILKLRFPKNSRMTVLGVSESQNHLDNLVASMDMIDKKFVPLYSVERKIRNGDPILEILSEALESEYDLVAVGGGGQLGLLHPKLGSTTSKLARKLHTHFLVARNVPKKVNRVLICSGAEAPASITMTLGGEWVSNSDAQIGLLHVLPEKSWDAQVEDAFEVKTTYSNNEKQDSILTHAIQQLKDAGVKNEIVTRIRRGLIVEEVLNELNEGGYELLVVGAHYQPGQDRWQGTLLDDVTDQLLNRCTCSVLIV